MSAVEVEPRDTGWMLVVVQSNNTPTRARSHPIVRLFRFVLRVQGAVVASVRVVADNFSGERVFELEVRRRTNSRPQCPMCNAPLTGEIKMNR